jgi:DNA mismatch endonuclease (patch repair protein)
MKPQPSTTLHRAIRRELHRRGRRFRINYPNLPGRPDLAFTRATVAVFVDDCFWRRCPKHCAVPSIDRTWWLGKLARTVARDQERDARLAELGWSVIHVWEHESALAAADRIEAEWQHRISLLRPRSAVAIPDDDDDEDDLDEDEDDIVHSGDKD